MTVAEVLRRKARELRELAAVEPDPAVRAELEALARRCSELARSLGNGSDHPEPESH